MKVKVVIEVEYEVDPNDYSFSGSGDLKKSILNFEQQSFIVAIADVIFPPTSTITVEIKEIK